MLFLVALDHVKLGVPLTPERGRVFIEQVIFPTLARAEQFAQDGKIVSGGAVLGRVSLRFIVEAASLPQVDQMVSSLPIWPLAETRVIPLTAFTDRRQSVQALLASLAKT